jgi:hypothetical protein
VCRVVRLRAVIGVTLRSSKAKTFRRSAFGVRAGLSDRRVRPERGEGSRKGIVRYQRPLIRSRSRSRPDRLVARPEFV